jgi:hypothetical protein
LDYQEGDDNLGVAGEVVEDGVRRKEEAVSAAVDGGVGGGEELEDYGCGVGLWYGVWVVGGIWGVGCEWSFCSDWLVGSRM